MHHELSWMEGPFCLTGWQRVQHPQGDSMSLAWLMMWWKSTESQRTDGPTFSRGLFGPGNDQVSSPRWKSLGTKSSFSKPQREGVKVTGSSCEGGGWDWGLRGRASCCMHPGAQVITPTGKRQYDRSGHKINTETGMYLRTLLVKRVKSGTDADPQFPVVTKGFESPSLELFRRCVGDVLRDMV